MRLYILRRLGHAFLSLFLVSLIVFALVRFSGDPVSVLAPPEASVERIEEVRYELGLDRPWPEQYTDYVGQILRGDLGTSIAYNRSTVALVRERLPATLLLGGVAFAVALLLSVPIGVYSAAHRGGKLDGAARGFAGLGQAIPPFWLGLMLILVFGVKLGILPTSGRTRPFAIVLPAVTLGWFAAAGIMRLTRSSMLGVLGAEYVKFARLKGLGEGAVLWKHGLRNAALPILTFAGLILVNLITGSVIVETVFSWPGVGSLAVDAARARDYPLVQTIVLLLSVLYVGGNLLVDLMYAYLDPRLRQSGS